LFIPFYDHSVLLLLVVVVVVVVGEYASLQPCQMMCKA
jgi:hypothetical protein